MTGPVPEQVEHYVRMLRQLDHVSPHPAENLCWTVVRPHSADVTVRELVRRLHGDPDTVTTRRPDDDSDYDFDDAVFLEQRGDAFVIVGYGTATAEADALRRLSRDATVHSVFWLINNFNRLYHLVDGVVITELDMLDPLTRWGTDPDALTDHLGALCDLSAQDLPGPDWETAMATLESLTGQRLDADWFARPQLYAEANRR
ncbi:DUF6461 domain-containing protein [Actinomadura bangladeshensis]|uniref:Uncharacterized protein n=1 Tax=Actinomadura bangladeshensis TaxID=453573 RepID=A0A4R4PBT8_9ACTN|nr:DUF6461 domain-containing protein [Actinomadura bangladeshensis]TDC20091.1 hypothetical protein E1284_01705 [Actinomadura bangladeshensis]